MKLQFCDIHGLNTNKSYNVADQAQYNISFMIHIILKKYIAVLSNLFTRIHNVENHIMTLDVFQNLSWYSNYDISNFWTHYSDVIMGESVSQIPSLAIVYSTVYSDADQRIYQSTASLAFVRGIHRWPVNYPHKGPVKRTMFPFDDVLMFPWIAKTSTVVFFAGQMTSCLWWKNNNLSIYLEQCAWTLIMIFRKLRFLDSGLTPLVSCRCDFTVWIWFYG